VNSELEFSNAMDVALNSYSIQADFGEGASKQTVTLDEYEKSFFLTKAQDEIFLNLYNGKNIYGDFFEGTEELRRYLDNLVVTKKATVEPDSEHPQASGLYPVTLENHLSDNSVGFKLPEDLAFITLEQVTYSKTPKDCDKNLRVKVYPVTQDEYDRVKDNPFRGPTRYKVLRLDYGNRKVELVPAKDYTIGEYLIKYLKMPKPIILTSLPQDLAIRGKVNVQTPCCEMNETLHNLIVDRAVTLAVQSKSIGINNSKSD